MCGCEYGVVCVSVWVWYGVVRVNVWVWVWGCVCERAGVAVGLCERVAVAVGGC